MYGLGIQFSKEGPHDAYVSFPALVWHFLSGRRNPRLSVSFSHTSPTCFFSQWPTPASPWKEDCPSTSGRQARVFLLIDRSGSAPSVTGAVTATQ